MKATFGRPTLILMLLSLALGAAVSTGVNARYDGVTVQAHIAGMQLQGGPATDEGSAAPDAAEDDKVVTCAQPASHWVPPPREIALVLSEDRQPRKSKASAVPGEEIPSKSKD